MHNKSEPRKSKESFGTENLKKQRKFQYWAKIFSYKNKRMCIRLSVDSPTAYLLEQASFTEGLKERAKYFFDKYRPINKEAPNYNSLSERLYENSFRELRNTNTDFKLPLLKKFQWSEVLSL